MLVAVLLAPSLLYAASVVIAVRTDATATQKQKVKAAFNSLRRNADTNNFNCFPSPQIWEHTPTSNRWAVVVWDRSQLASAYTNRAAFSNKLAQIEAAAGGVAWIKIEQVSGCAEFAATMKARQMVLR